MLNNQGAVFHSWPQYVALLALQCKMQLSRSGSILDCGCLL